MLSSAFVPHVSSIAVSVSGPAQIALSHYLFSPRTAQPPPLLMTAKPRWPADPSSCSSFSLAHMPFRKKKFPFIHRDNTSLSVSPPPPPWLPWYLLWLGHGPHQTGFGFGLVFWLRTRVRNDATTIGEGQTPAARVAQEQALLLREKGKPGKGSFSNWLHPQKNQNRELPPKSPAQFSISFLILCNAGGLPMRPALGSRAH